MARILFVTQELAGRVSTLCELGRRLQDRGHQVAVTSPVDIAARVEAGGLEFAPLSRLNPIGQAGPTVLRVSPTRAVRQLGELMQYRSNRAAAIEAHDPGGWTAGLQKWGPDLVLCDLELPVQIIIARSLGLPVALVSDQLSMYKRPGMPPLHRNVAPGEGWWGTRPGMEVAWAQYRLWKWLRSWLLRALSGGRDELSVLFELARRVGVPLRDEAQLYQWHTPLTYRSLPVLILNALELDFPHRPPPNVTYVGPVIDSRPPADPGRSLPEAVTRLREEEGDRTLIYAGLGAYHTGDETAFVRRVIDAVARQPDWELVIGLGRRSSGNLGPLPANIHPLEWAPQQQVLAKANVALLHGGITSVNEAVAAGVPMVVYPHSYNDTPGYAARIRYHRLGVTGDRTSDTAEQIHARIGEALANPEYRANVESLRRRFEADRSQPVEAVERLLAPG